MTDDERDLDAEQRAFEQRGWRFQLYRPMRTSPPNAPDPRIHRVFLAKATKIGDERRFQEEGVSGDSARAKLLDSMFAAIEVTEH
ncbi:hypothetical protein [Terrabacter sp. 2YAF2]|uniref:hypothetical protein n=1 Tax=Terrabacter sp. 2YAF2 TaxID=3233026 RepID=UPI003F9E0959